MQAIHSQLLCYLLFNKCARSSCIFWLSFISVIFQSHLGCQVVRKSYTVCTWPRSYCVKLQRQNIQNNVQQITLIQLTSVGLTHARSTRELFDHCGASLADHILSWHTDHACGISNEVCQPGYLHRWELSLTTLDEDSLTTLDKDSLATLVQDTLHP